MNALLPHDRLVTVAELEPLDEIAAPDQPDGPWMVVAIPAASGRIVVIGEDGTEHDVPCRVGQTVRLRRA